MGNDAGQYAKFQEWLMSSHAGYSRRNPDGSRYVWPAEPAKPGLQPSLTDDEREAILRLSPSGDPLAARTVTLTPEERRVFHGLLERLK